MSVRKKRNQFVAFYVDEQEKAAIIEAAQKADLSISDYCRKTLMNSSKEEKEEQAHVREDSE